MQTDIWNQSINGKTNKKIWAAGFSVLPAINATVFSLVKVLFCFRFFKSQLRFKNLLHRLTL